MAQVVSLETTRGVGAELDAAVEVATKLRGAWFMFSPQDTRRRNEMRELIPRAKALIDHGYHQAAIRDMARRAAPADIREIKQSLAALVAAFPNSGRTDLTAFGVALALDVVSRRPSTFAITEACRKLRHSSRFLPAIAEIMAAIDEAEAKFQAVDRSLRRLPEMITDAEAQLRSFDEWHARDEQPARRPQ